MKTLRNLCAICAALILVVSESSANILWDDGLLHTIDSVFSEGVYLSEDGTSVDVLAGGSVPVVSTGMCACFVSIYDGYVGELLTDNGPGGATNIYGGTIGLAHLDFDNLTMTGGTFQGYLYHYNALSTEISGGVVIGGIKISNDFAVNYSHSIMGGDFRGNLKLSDTSLDYSGGVFATTSIFDIDNSILNIYGHGLSYDGNILTGILLDGSPLSVMVVMDSTSTMNLHNVPIPATLYLFGSGLLGLVGVARRKEAA